MIPLGHFLEKVTSSFREAGTELTQWQIPPMDQSHVFYIGEDDEFTKAIDEIRTELHEEMKEKIPMPFDDVSIVSIVRKAMDVEAEKEIARILFTESVSSRHKVPEGAPVWVLDRMIRAETSHPAIQEVFENAPKEMVEIVKEWFLMARIHHYPGMNIAPLAWAVGYVGLGLNGYVRTLTTDAVRPMGSNIVSNLEQIAAISHPANYIVKVTPELSPKEARKVSAGAPRPVQKRPHFIVVDHEVLAGMRPHQGGTHASPVPHQRRGHWKRLAERCRHARLMGKEKVFVRPTFVGEKEFVDGKNHYEVLLDFGSKNDAGS